MPKGQITVNDPEAYDDYVEQDTPIPTGSGGVFVVQGDHTGFSEGDALHCHDAIEFPNYKAAKTAYHDPAFQKAVLIGRRTAESEIILVEGA